MKYITVNFVLLLLFIISFSLGDELGFPESIGNVEGGKKRSLDVRAGNNAIGVLKAEQMPVEMGRKFQYSSVDRQSTVSPAHSMQLQTISPRQSIVAAPRALRKIQMMTEAKSLPLGVPRFKTLPSHHLIAQSQTTQSALPKYDDNRQLTGADRFLKTMASTGVQMPAKPTYAKPIPEFQSLPTSIQSTHLVQPTKVEFYPQDEAMPAIDLKGHTVEELAAAAGVSIETIQSAIKIRQQQMITKRKKTTSEVQQQQLPQERVDEPSTTLTPSSTKEATTQSVVTKTSTTPYVQKKKVTKKPIIRTGHKVMNAPKEYYPAGYDKNFDDNFKSRIDLPLTSFHCGDQKHFPGLYGDQDLGCMVFHVCALTDEGLVMKSFLCPESTLFDQTILKCNWWFYTDCKTSKNLYDSNLPVSKSYQLMKSLAYFNKNYKNAGNTTFDFTDKSNHKIDEKINHKTAEEVNFKIVEEDQTIDELNDDENKSEEEFDYAIPVKVEFDENIANHRIDPESDLADNLAVSENVAGSFVQKIETQGGFQASPTDTSSELIERLQ